MYCSESYKHQVPARVPCRILTKHNFKFQVFNSLKCYTKPQHNVTQVHENAWSFLSFCLFHLSVCPDIAWTDSATSDRLTDLVWQLASSSLRSCATQRCHVGESHLGADRKRVLIQVHLHLGHRAESIPLRQRHTGNRLGPPHPAASMAADGSESAAPGSSGVSHRSVCVVGRLCSRAVNRIYRHSVTTSCYVILLFLAQLVLAYSMSNLKGIVHRIFYLPLCEWRLQEHFLIYIDRVST